MTEEAPLCVYCQEPLLPSDGPVLVGGMHHECSFRSIAGSVGHQKKLCSCFGGTEEDPPGATLREGARAALAYYQQTQAGIHTATLHEGPWDGLEVQVTHGVWKDGDELYVYDGGPDRNRLVYAINVFARMEPGLRKRELDAMTEWLKAPSQSEMPQIPPWRVSAWVEVLRYEVKV